MAPVIVLIIGVLLIYVSATGRAEAIWKVISNPKDTGQKKK